MPNRSSITSDFSPRRVVVTGIGLLCSLAIGTDKVWQMLLDAKSGIHRVQSFDPSEFGCRLAGEVLDFDPSQYIERKDVKKMARFAQFAVAAADMAIANAEMSVGAGNAERTGVCIGSAIGGLEMIERERTTFIGYGVRRVSPFLIPGAIVNSASTQVSIRVGARGPVSAIAAACASGGHAIGQSFRIIQRGDADVMICGGSEACISPLGLGGFDSLGVLTHNNSEPERASRPWDRDRSGFVLGEGAGILILEAMDSAQERKAVILAEIIGFGMSSDAAAVDGELGRCRSMSNAMRDAEIRPRQVDFINAHGLSTLRDDLVETRAVKQCFGEHAHAIAMSSTKSMAGHLLGASSAFDAGVAVLSLRDQIASPTINYESTDPECDLDYVPNQRRPMKMTHVISNSFGFGGTNSSLVFRAAPG